MPTLPASLGLRRAFTQPRQTLSMAAIAAFGLAMTLRDGLLMALGFVLSLVAVGVGFGMIGGGGG